MRALMLPENSRASRGLSESSLRAAAFSKEDAEADRDAVTAAPSRTSASASGAKRTVSQEHLLGTCEPCIFWTSPYGCTQGGACKYCHLEHPRRSFHRPRKQIRDKIKDRVMEIFREIPALRDLHDALQFEARSNPYALRIIQGHLGDEILVTWEGYPGFQAKWRPAGLIFSV
eukprot:Skav216648  [mRNA]  locus=scaffold1255:248965:249483:+ [translate_table: standard]